MATVGGHVVLWRKWAKTAVAAPKVSMPRAPSGIAIAFLKYDSRAAPCQTAPKDYFIVAAPPSVIANDIRRRVPSRRRGNWRKPGPLADVFASKLENN